MVLNFSPPPEFNNCSTKHFAPAEQHITRKHRRSVLILMLDGILRFREDGNTLELCAGEYYIQREGLLQEGLPLDALPVYFYIEYNGSYSEAESGLPLRGTYNIQRVLPLLTRFEELYKSRDANLFLLNSYMQRIFSELWRATPQHDTQGHLALMIRNRLDACYADPITLAEIARQLGYTEDYVIRLFKKYYRITPHRYRTELRMEQARWLLENTDVSAESAAYAVGYRDFAVFYRNFRKAYGLSPSNCKKT